MTKLNYLNISSAYESITPKINIEVLPYNLGNNQFEVNFSFNPQGLLYIKPVKKPDFQSKYSFYYEIFDAINQKSIIDSATFIYEDSTHHMSNNRIYQQFQTNLLPEGNLILYYRLEDLNKGSNWQGFINLKVSEFSTRIKLIDSIGNVITHHYLPKGQIANIKYSNAQQPIIVSYYKKEFDLAAPPYSLNVADEMPDIADSIFTINLDVTGTCSFSFSQSGLYYFQTDTAAKSGFSVSVFHHDYPEITTTLQMMKPLQYISTKKEFTDITASKNIKVSIDNFWLTNTGGQARAKEMIKIFYNRIQEANLYFTSFKEGWKTDRGLIYIIYGPPSKVYRSTENETWYYSEARDTHAPSFVFDKIENPYSENHYVLVRNFEYKERWYEAVEAWRR
jgi:GWxTD domain-containing protein